ncbi:MAG: TolC family protein [Bacteroidaceae bacterium]
MLKTLLAIFCLCAPAFSRAQQTLCLDDCRNRAITYNKSLAISKEHITIAHNERKAAATNYLPNLSITGGYLRNEREISLLDNSTKAIFSKMGTTVGAELAGVIKEMAQTMPDLAELVASLGNKAVPALNKMGQTLVDKFRTDTRNVWTGALTLTQPIYMGGKIRAYNKITQYAERLAEQKNNTELQELLLNTDQAYWQVVSLANKKKLAENYLTLLQKLNADVVKMVKEGVATKADELTVHVKMNEAEMTLTKVDNGLSLSRMLLCQLCGMDLSTDILLADENLRNLNITLPNAMVNVHEALSQRPELKSLELATNIYDEKVRIARAAFLPSAAFVGNYLVSNPSVFNSFENKFKGMWSLGVVVQIPVFHWGEGTYKIRVAKSEAIISKLQLSETREKIELQVNQSAYKVNEAAKKLTMSLKNMEKAEENLRYANLSFREGIVATTNVLEAQTAWLQAQSDKIDAEIDVKLTEVCLRKAMGTLTQ